MTNTFEQNSRRDAGLSDILGSMLGVATASTVFAIQQMQNAMQIFTDSQGVMNRVRDSMDNIADAMTRQKRAMPERTAYASEPATAEEAIHGRKV